MKEPKVQDIVKAIEVLANSGAPVSPGAHGLSLEEQLAIVKRQNVQLGVSLMKATGMLLGDIEPSRADLAKVRESYEGMAAQYRGFLEARGLTDLMSR